MDDWLFFGGFASLDLVNTRRERWSSHPRETLEAPASVGRWAVAKGLIIDPFSAEERELNEVRGFREALHVLAMHPHADPAPIELINNYVGNLPAATLTMPLRGGELVVMPPVIHSTAELLGFLAQDFIQLVHDHGTGKVKECGHDRCGLIFLDESRASARRWCSMGRCGNRAKAQRYAEKAQGVG